MLPLSRLPTYSNNSHIDSDETDKTWFRRFWHYATGHILRKNRHQSKTVQPHFRILTEQRPGEIPMIRYLLCSILLLALSATAQTPIPRVGDSCPTGTYRSGDYCKPIKSSSGDSQTIITKSGSKCPTGFYSSGSYCKRISSSDREAIPREDGGKCPTEWRKSGDYCVKI